MANMLDELNDETMQKGRDINVIAKQIKVTADLSEKMVLFALYLLGLVLIGAGLLSKNYILAVVGVIIPVFVFFKVKKLESYFMQLEQKLQQSASQIDNYLEQRVIVLQNTAKLVEKAVDLDKTVFTDIARLRSGSTSTTNESERNEIQEKLEMASRNIKVAFENYPDLESHGEIRDAMQQNLYLQREITAAREVYNDNINMWNREIFEWPFKKYVAGKKGYSTRIPFIASKEIKEEAKKIFFLKNHFYKGE